MKWHYFLFVVFSLAAIANMANANYWFQFGARGGPTSEFNSGASLTIQTIAPQAVSTGAPAFWVGEDLANGAFIQVGYLVVNQTASYPSYCSLGLGCTQYENINAGQAEWFYEYFPANYQGSAFLGAIGPAGSVGTNGTMNTYGFYANGTEWKVLFDGKAVGNVNLGAATSGPHSPVSFGELANATNNGSVVRPVVMSNLSVYNGASFTPVTSAYSYRGFGDGSQQGVIVPYGVQELEDRVNYFAIGSGLAMPVNGTQLWGAGYNLEIKSEYGNIASNTQNLAYSKAAISAPRVAYVNNATRAVFTEWVGSGVGAYSGPLNSTNVVIESNLTEIAEWQVQYFVDVSSAHGASEGMGWYNANATVNYGINSTTIYQNSTVRNVFRGWSNGVNASGGTVTAAAPMKLAANWQLQYLLNLTAQYGNTTGSGWKPANSTVAVSVYPTYNSIDSLTRLSFYSWSNGNRNSSFTLNLSHPLSLNAEFMKQYLYMIQAVDSYGNRIGATSFYANGREVNSTVWLFGGQRYNVTQAYYKGLWIPVKSSVVVNSSSVTQIRLPVYNVEISTRDIFGIPVNASAKLRFSNGTTAEFSTGNQGSLLIADAPYGSATGTVSYFIITNHIIAGNGITVNLIFLTPLDLIAFAIIIIAAILIYTHSSKRLRHRSQPPNQEVGFDTGLVKSED